MRALQQRTLTLANGERITVRCHYHGVYRLTLTEDFFGQIKHDGSTWNATIRETTTGIIKRFAGEWSTLREAVAELVDWKNGEQQPLIFRRLERSAHLPLP